MSALKRIYLRPHYSNALQREPIYVDTDISNYENAVCTIPYILESEHDRIVSELKKQHAFDLEQARFAYELQAINYEKQIEELKQLLK